MKHLDKVFDEIYTVQDMSWCTAQKHSFFKKGEEP
jgi:hypothetical protein